MSRAHRPEHHEPPGRASHPQPHDSQGEHTHSGDGSTGAGAHYERRTLREVVAYPPHGPREGDPHYRIFNEAKHHLVHVLGAGCWIGGATLAQIKAGLPVGQRCLGASQLEAHHAIAEFAGLNEIDWQRVSRDFPQVGIHSDEDFLRFAESEGGLMILCDKHHRLGGTGIHSVTYPAWLLDRYARDEWEFLTPGASSGG